MEHSRTSSSWLCSSVRLIPTLVLVWLVLPVEWCAAQIPDLQSVINQSRGVNYPEYWAEGIPGDYEMDSAMLGSEAERERLQASLNALPSLLVTTAPGALFNPELGIYTNTLEEGGDWERPALIEWRGDSVTPPSMVSAGIQIQGRSSRQPRTSPKHSFRIVFKGKYGPKTLRHQIFEDDEAEVKHNTLVLRATSNHSWTYPVAEQRKRAQYLRDPWVKDTQRAMGHVVPRSRFAHLYLNKMYWGVYAISERPDDAFAEENFGGDKEEYDVVKGGETVEGNDRAWRRLFALADAGLDDAERFTQFSELVDLDSFIDFMILNHFIGNETWDFGNWYASRRRADGEKFRFFCWDAEMSMNRIQENVVFTRHANRPTALFHVLRGVPEFQRRFSERARLHLGDGGIFSPEACVARWEELADSVESALFAESVRWGDYRLNVHPYRTGPFERYTVDEHWRAEKRRLLEEYFPARTEVLKSQYEALGLY